MAETINTKVWNEADDLWARANSAMEDADPREGDPRNAAVGVLYDALKASEERAERYREALQNINDNAFLDTGPNGKPRARTVHQIAADALAEPPQSSDPQPAKESNPHV